MKPDRSIHRLVDDHERRKWQNPEAILSGIGLRPGFTFIDIGCGSGFFTLPAARIVGTKGKVYGLDNNAGSIAILKEQAAREGLKNLYLTIGKAEESVICGQCADIVFFGMALHDFQDPVKVLKNARTMVKPTGRLANLDWKKEPMELGPPLRIRFDQEMAARLIEAAGFIVETIKDSGPYHYLIYAKGKEDKKMAIARQTVREEWLALTKEDPIDPELPICDPHVHIWGLSDPRYQAAKQAGKETRPIDSYLPDDLLRDKGTHNIVSTVFEECISMYRNSGPKEMRPVGETEFVAAQSGRYGTVDVSTGIVGFANLMLGAAVAPVIEAHIAAGRNKFRGIRESCTWPVNPNLDLNGLKGVVNIPHRLLNGKFREGFACLRKYGLSLDVGLSYPQLMELVDLSRAYPDTTIIVNHCGGLSGIYPHDEKSEEAISEWKHGIEELATCPNVFMKLGGMGSRTGRWYERAVPPASVELADAMAPYILWCIDRFGVERCMFEGNWPEDKILYSYIVIWNAFERIVEKFSASDKIALFHDTAVKAYRLTTI